MQIESPALISCIMGSFKLGIWHVGPYTSIKKEETLSLRLRLIYSAVARSIKDILSKGRQSSGPEEFVNLRSHFLQSSNFFGISSVQFSSLGTRLSGKFIQFSLGTVRLPKLS